MADFGWNKYNGIINQNIAFCYVQGYPITVKMAETTVHKFWQTMIRVSCANPESFVRGGPTLTSILVDERIQIALKAGHQSWPNIECWLGSFVFFQWIQTSIAKKPYVFLIFQVCVGEGGARKSHRTFIVKTNL